jgi:hypothetical protein
MKKASLFLLFAVLTALSLRADLLWQDATNYPYTDGLIAGQGQWFRYSGTNNDAFVTNNVLLLNATNKDAVGAPTNGWVNPGTITWVSFNVNVSQPPASSGYFCELRDGAGNSVCHLYDTTAGTVVPGTYRLGIANFGNNFNTYPLDLSTGVTYTVVLAYDTQVGSPTEGANLMINPSFQDYNNLINGVGAAGGTGQGFAYGTDTTGNTNLLNINVSYVGFSPYVNGGISNVLAGTDFTNVVTTNLPVIGIQPQPGTYYSGNPLTLSVVASGVDLQYQWYKDSTPLSDDGLNISGSATSALTISSLDATNGGSYSVTVTDAYGNQASTVPALESIITTATPPFFPTNVVALNVTNNLFTTASISDGALGTGPLSYQWYFAPTNTPNTFTAVSGQNSSTFSAVLNDYTYQGNYYVQVSSSLGSANGPTNSLTIIAPLQASISQLHNLMVAQLPQILANKGGLVPINTNQNVVVSGYVTTYGGFGNPTSGTTDYDEFFIQDTNGYGIEVFLVYSTTGGGKFMNTNFPPVGSYVTVTGFVEVYSSTLEILPANRNAIQINSNAPPFALQPRLCNDIYYDLSTNAYGTNFILLQGSLVSFTNVVFYKYKNPLTNGSPPAATFFSNSFTSLYLDIGGTNVSGSNTMACFQFGYNYGNPSLPNYVTNEFALKRIPTNCYQLTGVLTPFGGAGELLPSRLADYVTNPPAISARMARSKNVSTVSLTASPGSTYSVYAATNVTGPWTRRTYGLGYYPANASFTESNSAAAGYYKITSP